MCEVTTVPVMRVLENSIVLWKHPLNPIPRTAKQRENEKNLTRGKYNGYMSPKTRAKVKKYLSTWLHSVKEIRNSKERTQLQKVPYITFVTLTLPSFQMHSDNEIKRKCLTPFIETLKRKYGVWYYFWRAEAQENGNIHFHILVDSYIHYSKIRKEWNRTVNKLGYVDRFELKHGHDDPNSTDIHKLQKVQNLESYIIKYNCKEDGYRPIKGRIHGCHDDLRKLVPYEDILDSNTAMAIDNIIADKHTKLIEGDNFAIVICNTKQMVKKYMRGKAKEVRRHKLEMAKMLYAPKLEIIAPVDRFPYEDIDYEPPEKILFCPAIDFI